MPDIDRTDGHVTSRVQHVKTQELTMHAHDYNFAVTFYKTLNYKLRRDFQSRHFLCAGDRCEEADERNLFELRACAERR